MTERNLVAAPIGGNPPRRPSGAVERRECLRSGVVLERHASSHADARARIDWHSEPRKPGEIAQETALAGADDGGLRCIIGSLPRRSLVESFGDTQLEHYHFGLPVADPTDDSVTVNVSAGIETVGMRLRCDTITRARRRSPRVQRS